MSRFFLRITLVFLVGFTLLNITSRALGTLSPPNPVLAGFHEGCDNSQPCWYGIVPGEATINQSLRLLRQIGYNISTMYYVSRDELRLVARAPQCDVVLSFKTGSGQVINYLHFRKCDGVQLGDVMPYFGKPDDMDVCAPKPFLYSPRIIYRAGIVLYMDGDARSPLQDLKDFSLTSAQYFHSDRQTTWRGFAPDWHYVRYRIDEDC